MALSPSLFAIFAAFIRERLGLTCAAQEADVLEGKLTELAGKAGFTSLLDYYYFLRWDDAGGAALASLADSLVVVESYLFREVEPLAVAVRRFIAPVVAGGRRARVWSAACAAGEEPYTLAILLARQGLLDHVDLLATDISRRALARARRGVYSRRALRAEHDPAALAPHVTVAAGEVQVSPALARAIEWAPLNLLDDAAIDALGTFDVILCRNVLIYFDDASVERVVARLDAALEPEGALVIGVSESLLRFATTMPCEEHEGTFVYRKTPSRDRAREP